MEALSEQYLNLYLDGWRRAGFNGEIRHGVTRRTKMLAPLSLVVLILLLTLCQASAKHNSAQISAGSTDTSHSDADCVFLETSKQNASVVVARKRGIGSARIDIVRGWNHRLSIEFRGFTSLEKFSVLNGNRCLEGALKSPATRIGNWVNSRCDCARSKSATDILNMRTQGESILLDIPPGFVRSNQFQTLTVTWIDAYRN